MWADPVFVAFVKWLSRAGSLLQGIYAIAQIHCGSGLAREEASSDNTNHLAKRLSPNNIPPAPINITSKNTG